MNVPLLIFGAVLGSLALLAELAMFWLAGCLIGVVQC